MADPPKKNMTTIINIAITTQHFPNFYKHKIITKIRSFGSKCTCSLVVEFVPATDGTRVRNSFQMRLDLRNSRPVHFQLIWLFQFTIISEGL